MRVLLAHAIDTRNPVESLFAPLGLGYLAAALRTRIPNVEIEVAQKDVPSRIDAFRPDVVGISSVTQNFSLATEYARCAKERGIVVIVGGTHISSLPSSLPAEMDVGVVGEGEQALVELVSVLGDGGFAESDLASIAGLVYRDAVGELRMTEPRPPIDPLDQLSHPERELLDVRRHAPAYLFSSRGCPYRCVFCASSRFWPRIRAFSPEYVVREIEHVLTAYAPNLITFFDDLFIFDGERLARIVDLLEQRRIPDSVEFAISARANLIGKETVGLLKRMNVVSVSMGLESGSARTLEYLKPKVTVEQNARAVRLLHASRINVNASFVIGAPTETAEEILETLHFIERTPLNIVNTYLLTPLPGTPLWDYAEARGLVSADMEWERLAIDTVGDGRHVHISETLTPDELLALHRRFVSLARAKRFGSLVRQAFRSPRRIIPFLVRKAASARAEGGA